MTRRSGPPPSLDIAAMLPSWELALRAERKSPATLRVRQAIAAGAVRGIGNFPL